MADLIGEEQINWDTFDVMDEAAPEFTPPAVVAVEAPVEDALEPEDTAPDDTGRPRDPETGRFLPKEEAASDQPAELELELEPAADPILERFLQKYGGDPEAALKAAAHQTDLLGRQGAELGELRQQLSELMDMQRQQLESQTRPQFTQTVDIDSLIANEGVYAAAERTAEAGDWNAHNRVLREWEEMDPDTAGVYKLSKQAQYEAAVARQRAAELEQQQRQGSQTTAAETAWARLEREVPDLQDLAEAMSEEAAEAHRISGGKFSYRTMIESGDPDQAYLALRTLALSAQARKASSQEDRQRHAAELARTAAVESQRAKAEAIVASADATAPDPPPPQSYDEQLLAELMAQDQPRSDGWQVGNL